MRTIQIRGMEHPNAHEALVELNFTGDHAISIAGRYFTVNDDEFRRLEEEGISIATWHHHEATGRILCVPGRD